MLLHSGDDEGDEEMEDDEGERKVMRDTKRLNQAAT